MKSQYSVSVVVPIYNERANLPQAVEEIDRFLASGFSGHEVIIIESGSTDGSAELCDRLAATSPAVRVIHEGGRNGFGSALRLGFRHATKDWVWPLVVDRPYPPEIVFGAFKYLERYDCILSYRINDRRSRFRRIQSAVFNLAVRQLFGVRVRHVNSAFKFVKRPLLQSLALTAHGWLLDTELIVRLEQRRIPYIEIPVEVHDRTIGQSTVGPAAAISTFWELLVLRFGRQKSSHSDR